MWLAAWLAVLVATAPLALAHEGLEHPHAFADPAFLRLWSRVDSPVALRQVQRTWLWGPFAVTDGLNEPYLEAVGGGRLVQYFDKSRMELTQRDPRATEVTTGLLVVELVSGRLQLGDAYFEQRAPAQQKVAGDQRPGSSSPTYAALTGLLSQPPLPLGSEVTQTVYADGQIVDGGPGGVWTALLVPETGHSVPDVFWTALHAEDLVATADGLELAPLHATPFAATGYPITEPYWTVVLVNGRSLRVLVQAFERRVLTYTPSNPPGFQVEAGNVGLHYYTWRYLSR